MPLPPPIMYEEKNCSRCNKIYKPSSRHKLCPKCRSNVYDLCICGNTKSKISKHCKSCAVQVRRKGSRYVRPNGYVYLTIWNDNKSRQVFEHVLVMEQHIGRRLYKGETVHHKNGIKDDNRIENLELWTKSHPTGIRVEDAVKWALEILERYT